VAALTGETAAEVESFLTDEMGVDTDRDGVTASDLQWVFRQYGREMSLIDSYDEMSGPPLARWLDRAPKLWRRQHPLVVAVEARGHLPHWVTCWGPCVLDSLSDGPWVPLDGSGLGQRYASHAWTISPVPRVCGPVVMG
jgi:hypothetical protein